MTIQVGDSVTWTNEDSDPHTATAGDGSFDTGQLDNGESRAVTFDTAGTFAYICSIHPQMTGSVVVEAAGGAPAPTADGGATAAPTDTVAAGAAGDRAASAVALTLAALGVVMIVGTLVADRRFRTRD